MNRRGRGRVGLAAVSIGAIAALVAPCVGCGSDETVTEQAPPAVGSYAIAFPSVAAAIATGTVQVFAFPAGDDAASLCLTLLQKQPNGLDVSTAAYASPPIPTCDLFKDAQRPVDADAGTSVAGQIALEHGMYALLAVGLRDGRDFVIGCTLATFSASSTTARIAVALADTNTEVPALPATCDPDAPLAQHCDPTTAAKCSP